MNTNGTAILDGLGKNWWIITAFGVLSIIAGAAAFAFPLISSLGYSLYFGGLVSALGIFQCFDAFSRRKSDSVWLDYTIGGAAIVAGITIILFPLVGLLSLTLILGWFFFLDGVLRLWSAWRGGISGNRVWAAIGGLLSLFLGAIILLGFPDTSGYTLGTIWGVHAVYLGLFFFRLGWALRKNRL